ncbi:unnamed protein product [Rotaria sordida]|uniref:Uncharacterized protein n=1 Tax=Rotaria sordida TaxID=392033 RepID=A0A814TQP0_9BILA|nr:unnamed protein product [Rotaria sordida]CAF1163120.1 unnamed protein product [Rotaria sordida]CAF1245147.1 unnamed protein product [Rotaria sordida]
MDTDQQNQKDISKVFAVLRAKLNAKEKELLELQRAEPCLLAPDTEQIDTLLNAISSLHLSTQEGSFIFASDSASNSFSSTSVCSTGVDSIKTLPSTVWLPESNHVEQNEEQKNKYRLPMVTHLFSLPVNAFVASSLNNSKLPSCETTVQPEDEPSNRLPMVSQLFSMPINAFKSSSNIQTMNESALVQINDTKKTVTDDKNILSTTEVPKSILNPGTIYSKEHWLRKTSSDESESIPLDLDSYIQQTTEKMRRLHMEYVEALEKLKTPSNPVDSSKTLKTMYPQMFDRIKQEMPTKNPT